MLQPCHCEKLRSGDEAISVRVGDCFARYRSLAMTNDNKELS